MFVSFFGAFFFLGTLFLHTNAHIHNQTRRRNAKNFAEFIFSFPTYKKRLHFYFFLIVVVVVAEGIFSLWILFHFISSIQIFDIDSLQLRMTGRTDTNKHSRKETNQKKKKTFANILLNASCCCCRCYYLLCSINWCFFFFEWFFAYLLSIYNIAVVVVVVVSCISISMNQSILSLTAPSLCNASLLPNRTRAQC